MIRRVPVEGKPHLFINVGTLERDQGRAGAPHLANPAYYKPRCPELGEELPGRPCGQSLHVCNADGATVTRVGNCEGAARDCQTCDLRPLPPAPRYQWVSTARLVAGAIRLAAALPANCAGIVGIPRSGMLPAATIATHLHLPLYQLSREGEFTRLSGGSRGNSLYQPGGPLAVIDDTVYGGDAMARARRYMGGRAAVYAAVFVRPESAGAVDHFAEPLPSPHLLEWNAMNNGPFAGHAANPAYRRGLAIDLDGIVVHDDASGGTIGAPYLVPRAFPCRLIATGRPEAHRAGTEAQLAALGVRWERLEMMPGTALAPWQEVADFKARHYAASDCGFFVESDPDQAERIQGTTKRPVICPAMETVYQ